MQTIAIVDRFSDHDTAVLLVEDLNQEFIISQDQLPRDCRQYDCLDVTIIDGVLVVIGNNVSETKKRKDRIHHKMSDLRARKKRTDRKRKK